MRIASCNYNFKILYNKRKHLPLKQLELFIESNKEVVKRIDEDFIVNILNHDTMLTNLEYYKKLDILVNLYIIMDTTGDFDDIYEKIKELENLKEEIQIKNPIGIADDAKKLEKNKKKYNIMINDIQEEYIELTEAKEEIKFRKSSQPDKFDTIAVGFIKSLFEGSNQFKTIFFDNGNGEKQVTLDEAKELLSKPVVKLIESGKLKQTETEKKAEVETEKKPKTEKKPETKSNLVKDYLDKAKEGGKKFLDGLIGGALDMQTASYEEDPDAKVITEKKTDVDSQKKATPKVWNKVLNEILGDK